jgi:hypothetical protein
MCNRKLNIGNGHTQSLSLRACSPPAVVQPLWQVARQARAGHCQNVKSVASNGGSAFIERLSCFERDGFGLPRWRDTEQQGYLARRRRMHPPE